MLRLTLLLPNGRSRQEIQTQKFISISCGSRLNRLFRFILQFRIMLHEVNNHSQVRERHDLKALRSDLLDSFADLEGVVCSFLKDAKLPLQAPHFGARVAAFRNIEGISRIAKVNYQKRDSLADEITALLPVRADIVHSRIQIYEHNGIPAARFVNSQNKNDAFPHCRILLAGELLELIDNITRIVDELGKLNRPASQPSSPLPPSPA